MKNYTNLTYTAKTPTLIWPTLAIVTFLGLVIALATPAEGATKSDSTKTFLSKVEKLEAAKKAKDAKKAKKAAPAKVAPGTLLTVGDNGKITFHVSKEKVARHLLLKIQGLEKRKNFLELQVDDLINRLVLEKLKAAQKR